MDFEFDKEIDAILRKARGDEIAADASSSAHLDADEISAFAENALPAAARQNSVAHLANCARCRKILAGTIVFETEAAAGTASSAVSAQTVASGAMPWYRRLFAFPQAAYAMGLMVLLFGGFFGYLILQNLPGARDSEVSYSTNTAPAPAAERSAAISNSNAASSPNAATTNATTTNSIVQSNATAAQQDSFSAGNSARLSTSNTTTAAKPPPQNAIVLPESADPAVAEVQPMATPAPKPQAKDESVDKNLAMSVPATPNAAGATRQRNERDQEDSPSTDSSSTTNAPEEKSKNRRAMPNALKKQENRAGEQRSVGGKTFNNVGGIWFDSAVGNRSPKTVRRGTSDYQKLDAGLRSIAETLGGTIVVLWGGRAYRIQ